MSEEQDAKPGATGTSGSPAAGEPEPLFDSPIASFSRPKGGGALSPIDDSFQVNPNNGTCTYRVAILTSSPAGRGGAGLQVDLSYNSGAGNGPFGMGWALSVPSITRRTDKGLPNYTDMDTFSLSGAEDLELVGDVVEGAWDGEAYLVSTFRPRVETTFDRIERWVNKNTSDPVWRVRTRDNVEQVFGRTGNARVADPADPKRVFSWSLSDARDDRGNAFRYEYLEEDGQGLDSTRDGPERTRFDGDAYQATSQRYLRRVQYGNVTPLAAGDPVPTAPDAWLFELVFDHGEFRRPTIMQPDDRYATRAPVPERDDPGLEIVGPDANATRSDPFSARKAGFDVRTLRLCRRALLYHRFPDKPEGIERAVTLVASTDFFYDEGPAFTHLTSVVQAGYVFLPAEGRYARETKPAVEFDYYGAALEVSTGEVRGVGGLDSVAGTPLEFHEGTWTDLDGDGLPGRVERFGQTWYYRRNLGEARLAEREKLASRPAALTPGDGGARFVDLGGEPGKSIARFGPPSAGFQRRQSDGGWTDWKAFESVPTYAADDPSVQFLDLDGDGLADLVIWEEGGVRWYPSLGQAGFSEARTTYFDEDFRVDPAPALSDAERGIFTADMTGDGLADIVEVTAAGISYWPGLGFGRFGSRIAMPGFVPGVPDFDPRRLRVADIDGSGTADLIYLGVEVLVFLNRAGNSFAKADADELPRLGGFGSGDRVEILDLLGKGMSCLVWSSKQPRDERRAWRYAKFTNHKPHLLRRIRGGYGSSSHIRYKPSTSYFLEDRAEGIEWLTRLRSPIHLVRSIRHYDEVASTSRETSYRYRHGFYCEREREFRGFAHVRQLDTEELDPSGVGGAPPGPRPPVEKVSWFHTGAWRERGQFEEGLRSEYFSLDGAAQLLPDTAGLPESDDPGVLRDAARALRGSLLREEVYALDGTELEPYPYTVAERSYRVKEVGSGARRSILYVHPAQSLSYQYDRSASPIAGGIEFDPTVVHEFVLGVDAFGVVRRSARVAYGRRGTGPPTTELIRQQRRTWIVCTDVDVLHLDSGDDGYRLGVPIGTYAWDLEEAASPAGEVYTEAELRQVIDASPRVAYADRGPTLGATRLRLVEAQLATYFDDALQPLPVGKAGIQALPREAYRAALCEELVEQSLEHDIGSGPAGPDWGTLEQECGFLDGAALEVDPAFELGVPERLRSGSWFARSGESSFGSLAEAAGNFFQVLEVVDPWGHRQIIELDDHKILLAKATDAVGNVTSAANDYRVLGPMKIIDANLNEVAYDFDAFGHVTRERYSERRAAIAPLSALGEVVHTHDLHAFRRTMTDQVNVRGDSVRSGAPISLNTISKQLEGTDAVLSELFVYSDGFGREVLRKERVESKRAQRGADGTPVVTSGRLQFATQSSRWLGSGRVVYDDKGSPVRKYEPYFSGTSAFETEVALRTHGETVVLSYDPVGRVVRTDFPDGSFSREGYSPWVQTSWDQNDTDIGGPHENTPTRTHRESLGRVVAVERDPGDASAGTFLTRHRVDVEGNVLEVIDARGSVILEQDFDLLSRVVRSASPDFGERRTLADVRGAPVRAWDSRGHALRYLYDGAGRPTHMFGGQVSAGEQDQLLHMFIYGEQTADPEANNLRGQLHQVYDGAGRHELAEYDGKGNAIKQVRTLLTSAKGRASWDVLDPGRTGAGTLAPTVVLPTITVVTGRAAGKLGDNSDPLSPSRFVSSAEYDFLDRPTKTVEPNDAQTEYTYHARGGGLRKIALREPAAAARTAVVEHIEHNERGQRGLVAYGNGTYSSFGYDKQTFRLVAVDTRRERDGRRFQQDRYEYDPVGNVTEIRYEAQKIVRAANTEHRPACTYSYDALYQLTEATGLEAPQQQPGHDDRSVRQHEYTGTSPRLAADDVRAYRRTYSYDKVGNLTKVHQHRTWTRVYAYEVVAGVETNRLSRTSDPNDATTPTEGPFTHDAHGNMESMPGVGDMRWNVFDQLEHVHRTGVKAYYQYDYEGNRVRQLVLTGSSDQNSKERVYIGAYEHYRSKRPAADPGTAENKALTRDSIHVSDGMQRALLVETKRSENDVAIAAPPSLFRFQLSDHLGSSHLELDAQARPISLEIYYPFGSTAYASFKKGPGWEPIAESRRRYRFVGKERDEKTGLILMGARYYAPWSGRWTAADPIGLGDGENAFAYVGNNPIRMIDPSGTSGVSASGLDDDGLQCVGPQETGGGANAPPVDPDSERFDAGSLDHWETVLAGAGVVLGGVVMDAAKEALLKGIAKFIPLVGQALIAKDIFDAIRALPGMLDQLGEFKDAVMAAYERVTSGEATVGDAKLIAMAAFTIVATVAAGAAGRMAMKKIGAWLKRRRKRGGVKPSDVNFSQPTVSQNFSKNVTINETAAQLRRGDVTPSDIPKIRVVDRDGQLFTLDNRRLAAFQAGGVKKIPVERLSLSDPAVAKEFAKKFNPVNGGRHVVVTPNAAGRTQAERILRQHGKIQ